MDDERLKNLLDLAKSGDTTAREQLIQAFRPFITEVAAAKCKRKLEWENDDELSISLLAFNQAIDNFDVAFGKKFHNYAAMVIKSRLVDYFRKEKRHQHLSLDIQDDVEHRVMNWERKAAWEKYEEEQRLEEQALEMQYFEQELQEFGISLHQLERSSPSHRDTRDKLLNIAVHISKDQKMSQYLTSHKRLPLKELIQSTGNSKKVIKRGRNYIIALFLIISKKEFSCLRSLFALERINPEKVEGGKANGQD